MLRFNMLCCHVTLCYVTLRYVVLCMLRYVNVMLCYVHLRKAWPSLTSAIPLFWRAGRCDFTLFLALLMVVGSVKDLFRILGAIFETFFWVVPTVILVYP